MANINDIHSVVIQAHKPNMTEHTYSEIYGGSAGCTITVNGVSLAVGATSNIKIWVKTVSGGNGCFLLGEFKDVFLGSPNAG